MRNVFNDFISLGAKAFRLFYMRSLRFYLVCISLALCLAPLNFYSVTPIDRAFVYLSAKLTGIQRGSAMIAIVTVPDEEADRWQADFYDTDSLSSVLSNVLHSSQAKVGLLLDDALGVDANVLDTLIEASPSISVSALRAIQKKRYLRDLLNDSRVTLGLVEPIGYKHALTSMPSTNSLPVLHSWTNRWLAGCDYCANYNDDQQSSWRLAFPLGNDAHNIRYWSEGAMHASFLAALLMDADTSLEHHHADEYDTRHNWQEGRRDNVPIPMRRFLPAHNLLSSYPARVIDLALIDAQLVSAFPEYVLIGSEKNYDKLVSTANSLYSIKAYQAYVLPWWGGMGQRLILILLVIYFCFFHHKWASLKARLSVWAVLVCLSVLVTLYGFVQYRYWFPLSVLFVWSVVIAVLMHYWRSALDGARVREQHFNEALSDAVFALEESQHIPEAVSLMVHHADRDKGVEKICQLSDKLVDTLDSPNLAITLLHSALDVTGQNNRLLQHLDKLKARKRLTTALVDSSDTEQGTRIAIPQSLGRYQIQQELGRGAVGVVYLGFDPAISREVAIKTLDARQFSRDQIDSLKSRFFREAEAAGRLNHPNIVSVYDVGEEGDLAYIAMDYIDGQALSDCIRPPNLLPVSTVYRIVYQVAIALSYAHDKQIVHRDIKPGNVMYAAQPFTVKVTDFGIARLLDNSRTRTGEILGSPLYMAPEQLKGSKVAATADIFSLGVTFFQLLAGELPFNADNLAGLTYEIIHTKHRSVRAVRKDLPASAARIINQCLQKSPHDRYESASELAVVLAKAIKRDFPADAKRFGIV